jgi:3'(2'), 5'-bisphosphate nucleotidase
MPASQAPPPIDLGHLRDVARRAGEAILEIYARDFEVEFKADESPLTEADQRANDVIVAALEERYPEIPIISEEIRALDYSERRGWDTCWLVDPLDGTKEFVKKNGEFTVNIALIHAGEPVAGVVYRPVTGAMYSAERGRGAYLEEPGAEPVHLENTKHYSTEDDVTVVASRSHLSQEVEDFVAELRAAGKQVEFQSAGSSLKLCLVAEGKATVYPRFAPTMEWDTAAAHAVVLEAGKKVLDRETGAPLTYNKENLLNPWFIVE